MNTKDELLDIMKKIVFPPQPKRFNIRRGNMTNCGGRLPDGRDIPLRLCKADMPTGFVLGKVRARGSALTKENPLVIRDTKKTFTPKYKPIWEEAKQLMKEKDPKFKFTSIQFNKNNRTKKHKDGFNVGESYIIGLGDYTGGDLIVYDENGNNPKRYDIKNKWLKFNGSIFPHETAPFKGDRYTLVYYNLLGGGRKLIADLPPK